MKTEKEVFGDLENIVGHLKFPLSIKYDRSGAVTAIEFEQTWKEGTTHPTGKLDEQGHEIFRDDYEEHSLTKEQVSALDKYIADYFSDKS